MRVESLYFEEASGSSSGCSSLASPAFVGGQSQPLQPTAAACRAEHTRPHRHSRRHAHLARTPESRGRGRCGRDRGRASGHRLGSDGDSLLFPADSERGERPAMREQLRK